MKLTKRLIIINTYIIQHEWIFILILIILLFILTISTKVLIHGTKLNIKLRSW